MRIEGGQAGGRTGGRWFRLSRTILSQVRQVAGMPDYEAYLEHVRADHPGMTPISEREFFERYVRARIGGVTRCC
jgi:uncharacterized short protein YbdD (DUF466 family)